jgi:predicted acetyltransferase/N-acetylglutamate synthase-like GNAT family acetyltransferase
MQIRRAIPADAPKIAALHRSVRTTHLPYLPDLHTPAEDRQFFTSRVLAESEVWLAEANDLLGFVASTSATIDHLYVRTDAQGRGIGTRLLEIATQDGMPRTLHAFQRNQQAQRFYLARGWRPVSQTDGSANEEGEPDTRFAWPPAATVSLTLRTPDAELLPSYISAMLAGWSPSTMRDIRNEQLADIRENAATWLHEVASGSGKITIEDGRVIDRLPGGAFWLWDGAFCGSINLRHVPGSEELPPHVSGHIGYSVVPWKRRRGYATRALALVLEKAAALGLERVVLTCDDGNVASRAVIEANGGELIGTKPHETRGEVVKLQFRVPTRR